MLPHPLSLQLSIGISSFFFFNDTATTEIYTLSLHDALPIFLNEVGGTFKTRDQEEQIEDWIEVERSALSDVARSEEHTSELQSRGHLVCRLLLEKKKKESKETTAGK